MYRYSIQRWNIVLVNYCHCWMFSIVRLKRVLWLWDSCVVCALCTCHVMLIASGVDITCWHDLRYLHAVFVKIQMGSHMKFYYSDVSDIIQNALFTQQLMDSQMSTAWEKKEEKYWMILKKLTDEHKKSNKVRKCHSLWRQFSG